MLPTAQHETDATASTTGALPSPAARLARNRATARLRREKKKKEAETLTSEMTDIKLQYAALTQKLSFLPAATREDIERLVSEEERNHPPPRGCLFCDSVFVDQQDLLRHCHNDHPSEFKGELSLTELTNTIINTTNSVSGNSDTSSGNTRLNNNPMNGLSSEERRKMRLERNAESARLCRQRKKYYIQKLRLEIPKLKYKNQLLEKFIGEHKANSFEITNAMPVKLIDEIKMPKNSGWDHTRKRYKRKYSDVSEPQQMPPTGSGSSVSFPSKIQHSMPLSMHDSYLSALLSSYYNTVPMQSFMINGVHNLLPQNNTTNMSHLEYMNMINNLHQMSNSRKEPDVDAAFALTNLGR